MESVRGNVLKPGMRAPMGVENVTREGVGEKMLEYLGELRKTRVAPED